MEDNIRIYGAYKEDDGWHGYEERNHKTPSGCDRFLMTWSDKESWPSAKTAILKIKEKLGVKNICEVR